VPHHDDGATTLRQIALWSCVHASRLLLQSVGMLRVWPPEVRTTADSRLLYHAGKQVTNRMHNPDKR
jgi:hypothetical protein